MHGNCHSNNLIYCLRGNTGHIKFVGQTKNRLLERFQSHLFDATNHNNTTVATYFTSHVETDSSPFMIHILEYIKVSKDIPRSKSVRGKRELTWIHRLTF